MDCKNHPFSKVADAKKFDVFQQPVQRILESDPKLGQYAEQVRAAYLAENSPALAGLTNADGTIDTAALEEDVCLKTFERLIGDPEELTQAVAHGRTVIESFLDVLRGIKNSVVIKLTGSEKAMLGEAERTLVNLLRGEAGMVEGERFSIQKDANGELYVLIDTDQELFEGQSMKESIRTAEKYMKKHFQGQLFDIENSRTFVNGKAIGEYTHPANYRLDPEIKQAKINASTELDNLLAVSKFLRHEEDDGRHADATNGWEVYQTRFVLNGESFVGEVKIKLTDRGKLFYDITHIEKAARID